MYGGAAAVYYRLADKIQFCWEIRANVVKWSNDPRGEEI